MDRIFMENFRCFRKLQSARLAPLTLLVGENSTGKTSFLALVRALWRVAFQNEVPDFREEPYDLGTFADTVYDRGGRSKPATSFKAGFGFCVSEPSIKRQNDGLSFEATFENKGAFPFPVKRRLWCGDVWYEAIVQSDNQYSLNIGSKDEQRKIDSHETVNQWSDIQLNALQFLLWNATRGTRVKEGFDKELLQRVEESLFDRNSPLAYHYDDQLPGRPYASGPVRSHPRRTYDPTRPRPDPEGEYIPTYLASMSQRDKEKWDFLKSALENFGQSAGLFDEIAIKSLGPTEGTPFQIQVRKFGGRVKGPWRNLIDVGYGVSQVLPVLTELLHPEPAPLFLLQQPEVHLHPSAQAALGSLFCSVAGPERQLIVETHSDYLLDRVRMDVRDKKTDLKPEDVSILYFERDGLEVNIHSLRLDEMGNVLDAPPGYGQFFMDEVTRSIGF